MQIRLVLTLQKIVVRSREQLNFWNPNFEQTKISLFVYFFVEKFDLLKNL